jgi:hypothetical protein
VDPSHPYWIELERTEGVGWYHSLDEPVGCQAAAWSNHRFARPKLDEPFAERTEDVQVVDTGEGVGYHKYHKIDTSGGIWRFLRGTYVFRVEPQPYPYRPENVNSGVSRPEQGTNLWIADPAQPWPHWLELDFGRSVTFNTVQLTFDSNLDRQMDEGVKALGGPIPELVKAYTVFAWCGEGWRLLFQERDNHQRWRHHVFAPVTTQRLRILFEATHVNGPVEVHFDPLYSDRGGGGTFPAVTRVPHTARLFEIRVYHE